MIIDLINSYKKKGILVDSNLLLLMFIGYLNKDYITKFKRTQQYLPEDFDLLNALLITFNKIITTPNILTEVSNLANSLSGDYKKFFGRIFSKSIESLNENYLESKLVINSKELLNFGLTDSVILKSVKGKYLLLTDDLPLYYYAIGNGVDAINFNHIREY